MRRTPGHVALDGFHNAAPARLSKWRIACVAVVMALLATACSSAEPAASPADVETPDESQSAAWEPEYVDGVLQPLPDGFPDQTITLVNGDTPSHDDGLYARAFQAALQDISPVEIAVTDEAFPSFGTWTGIQFMENQPGGDEGYYAQVVTFTGAALDLLTEPIESELGYDLADINPVIATEFTPFVVVTRADAPWDTFEEMVQAAKESPGELRYAAAFGTGLDIAMERLMSLTDIEVNKFPVDGGAEAATTVGAGEADFTMLTPALAVQHQDAGRVEIILIVSQEPEGPEAWPNAVTTEEIGFTGEPWGSVRGFAVLEDVEESHRLWLHELFSRAVETGTQPQERIDQLPGASAIMLDKEGAFERMETMLEVAEPIVRELGLHYEDNQ